MRMSACLLVLLILSECCPANGQSNAPVVSSINLGKRITVVGWAVNRKIGAQLIGTDFQVWIDGLRDWPRGYYSSGDKGKKVRVSGILAEDYGLPAFIREKGRLPRQGIPLPEGTDLKKARHRYLLKNAVWELVNK